MKAFLLINVLCLLSGAAHAGPFVEMSLTPTMKSDTLYSYTKRPRVQCGRITSKTKGPYAHNYTPAAALALSTDRSATASAPISLNVMTGNQTNEGWGFWRTIRTIKSNVDIVTTKDSSIVTVKLEDNKPYDQQDGKETINDSSSCTFRNRSAHYHTPLVTGTVKVGYRVPENIWLVKVERVQGEKAFNLSHLDVSTSAGMKGAMNSPMDKGLLGKSYFLWVKPGSIIEQEFVYSEENGNHQTVLDGRLQIKFTPMATTEENTLTWLRSDDFNPISLHAASPSESQLESELLKLLHPIQEPGQVKKLVERLSTREILNVLDKLGWLISANVDTDGWINLKIAASILAHKLAGEYLDDLLPFCEMTTVELPYKNRELKTSWLAVASFLISKTNIRLREYSVADINALVDVLADYQQQGRTYADVRNDQASYARIIKAYQVLKETMDFRASPLATSHREIQYIVDEKGSLGTGEDVATQLLGSLTSLADQEQTLVRDVLNRIRKFQGSNDQLVNVDDLKDRIQGIDQNIGQVMDVMSSGSQLLAVSQTGLQEMLGIIITVGSDSLVVFSKEGKGDYEFFRQAYFNQQQLEQTKSAVQSCMVEED